MKYYSHTHGVHGIVIVDETPTQAADDALAAKIYDLQDLHDRPIAFHFDVIISLSYDAI